ncbi:MAG TPA: ribosome maturation factor RimM [Solirubrobacteraceae bacterium]|nr:ribosome maturation factor RimM [Solirubrobacteraceae bacterium]
MRAGRVGRAHGLDGFFHVIDALPGLLVPGAPIQDLGEVVSVKGTDAAPIVKLSTASDRTAAEALRGRELIVVGAEKPPLEADEYAAEDLEGCAVVTTASAALGTVQRLLAYPSCELLELDDGTLVPLVRDCIVEVDVASKRITVNGEFLGAA